MIKIIKYFINSKVVGILIVLKWRFVFFWFYIYKDKYFIYEYIIDILEFSDVLGIYV